MAQKSSGKDPNLASKLNKLKEKQDNWMKERDSNKQTPSKNYVHSSLKESDSSSKHNKAQQDVRKAEAVVWATNSNYNGFVVRNGSGSARSRPNSTRTPNKKTFTHSSLKNQQTTKESVSMKKSRDVTTRPARKIEEKQAKSDDDSIQSDESLSSSFTEHIANLSINDFKETDATDLRKTKKSEHGNTNKNNFMANHFCVLCKQAMVTEDRMPTMVFPCGHSFCRKCIINKGQCPDCDCDIISTQTNSALYAVIRQFKQKTEKEEMERKEKQIRIYLDEYKNLNTRISIMKGEATNIIDDMEGITHNLIDKQKTIKKIEYNIEEIETEIRNLKQLIVNRHRDIETESDKVVGLEKSYDKQKGQLNMLQSTISSLSENKERMREMVGDLSPNAVAILDDLDEEC